MAQYGPGVAYGEPGDAIMKKTETGFIILAMVAVSLLPAQGAAAGPNSRKTPPPRRPTEDRSKPTRYTNLRSREISQAEARLSALGYWTGKVDGTVDLESRSALVAFQKAEGLPRTGRFSQADLDAISDAAPISPRERSYYHVEVDLDHQILFIVGQDSKVSNVLPISTGGGEEFTSEGWTREAITPTGRFSVHEKISGWHKGPLGRIYYPNYILGGLAIHGYPSVPVHPASHGCIRIPMFAAQRFSEMTPVGTVVLVYGSKPPKPSTLTTGQRAVAKSDGL
jgi:lipoprotein-anchoring transpeptidase ErfK/SrfK